VAANPSGEDRGPATGRRFSLARIATIAVLALAVLALGVVVFGGGGDHKYNLLFQNASQLVPDNQVLIGGQPVGSVEDIELTDDNLAKVVVSVEQELHEGSTATIRATSLSGVANHYVSISPGPNNNPSLDEGATLGLASTTTPVDIDQFFNTFPPPVRRALGQFFRGNAEIYAGRGADGSASRAFEYFGVGLNRTAAFVHELNSDERLFSRFLVASSRLSTAVSERSDELASAIANASDAFGAIASENEALDSALQLLPPTFRQANTTFVNLRAALDDLDPLVDDSKPVAKKLRPFLAELRPLARDARPTINDLSKIVSRPGAANDLIELTKLQEPLRDVTTRKVKANGKERDGAFKASQDALKGNTPEFAFFRPYTPDLLGWFDDFSHSGVYDALGAVSRVAIHANAFALTGAGGAGQFEVIPPELRGKALEATLDREQNNRCPGGGEHKSDDGTGPYKPTPDFPCDASQVLPGQ
jgi:phospholipid/cholesterol/gamma-HCH transport system substrate-binding protein